MAVRALLTVLAVAAIAVGATQLRGDRGCRELRADVARAPAGRLAALAAEADARCGAPADRAAVAVTLSFRDRRDLTVRVVRRMTESSPDDYVGWLALWRLTHERAALVRAHELNARGTPSP
jgi:hypothetical protein